MKVKIGKYLNWYGPYQLVDMLFFWHEKYPSDELDARWDYVAHDKFAKWLASTPVMNLCQWVQDKRKRTEKVHIDNYDVWNMAETLATITLPMLIKLRECKSGSGWIEDIDVPELLRSTSAPAKEHEYDWDNNASHRYNWFLDELIWTFRQLQPDCDWEGLYHSGTHDILWLPAANGCSSLERGPKDTHVFDSVGHSIHQAKIQNGLRLFGKYYMTLWD